MTTVNSDYQHVNILRKKLKIKKIILNTNNGVSGSILFRFGGGWGWGGGGGGWGVATVRTKCSCTFAVRIAAACRRPSCQCERHKS